MNEDVSNVKDFGAVGDGVNDDTKAIQDAIDGAEIQGRYVVFVPPGVYRLKNKIKLKSHVIFKGIRGKSKIVISDFLDKTAEGILSNEHFSRTYKPDTADEITVDGIDFEFTRVSRDYPKTILFFANAKRVTIQNCSFSSFNTFANTETTHLDLYACCKNVKVINCDFTHINEGTGGCIWVRNLTSAVNNLNGDITCNVEITGCNFTKSSRDEIIAVFSTRGDVKDVSIHDNTFNVTHDARMSFPFSAYPAENIYHGGVENVTFERNTVYMERVNTFLFMLGLSGRTNLCRNIKIKSNRFFVNIPDNKAVHLFYCNVSVTDTSFEGNYVEVNASPEAKINYVCINIQDVHGNTIKGSPAKAIENGIYNAQRVTNNVLDYVSTAISTCRLVSNNTISHCRYGIVFQGDVDAIASNNIISLESEATYCGAIRVKSEETRVSAVGNVITTTKKNDYAIYLENGLITLVGNLYRKNPAGDFKYIKSGKIGYTEANITYDNSIV